MGRKGKGDRVEKHGGKLKNEKRNVKKTKAGLDR